MSGLEPLAAFGLACNVITVVDSAIGICATSKHIFERGQLPDSHTAVILAKTVSSLMAAFRDVGAIAGSAAQILTPADKELVRIARDSATAALELKAEVDKSTNAAAGKGHLFRAVGIAVKAITASTKKRVEKLEKTLQAHQKALETRLLANVCNKTRAIEIRQKTDFETLDSTLRAFIQRYSEGETKISALLAQDTAAVRSHITEGNRALTGHITTESQNVKDRIAAESVARELQTQHERLLKSLKYPSMNARRNQIVDPGSHTFEWIFTGPRTKADGQDSISDGSDRDETYFCTDEDDYLPIKLASERFLEWLQGPAESPFWISGKPGSGKSTLMKFLADDPRTLERLGLWSSDVVVLTHFFWMAGHPMERKIKGVLCSLLYQAVELSNELTTALLQAFPLVQKKDCDADWSEKELRAALLFALERSPAAFCCFIDGLDEVDSTDGQLKLLDLVDELVRMPRFKLCISSRPEPILLQQLGRLPMIRIQDLTRGDIWRLASATLRNRFAHDIPATDREDFKRLVTDVCDLSDGVILWVILALQSLLSGFHKGDSFEELERRLRLLPPDLKNLYASMWQRLGEEKELYEDDAARYLNFFLLLGSEDLLYFSRVPMKSIRLLLATDAALAETIITSANRPSFSVAELDLERRCHQLQQRIRTRCLGLLEITQSAGSPYTEEVRFVHRSALEFLKADEEAQKVLKRNRISPGQHFFNLVQSDLAIVCLVPLYDSGSNVWESVEIFLDDVGGLCKRRDFQLYVPRLAFLARHVFESGDGHAVRYLNWAMMEDSQSVLDWIKIPGHDFAGLAAAVGDWQFLREALRQQQCRRAPTSALPASYSSYLLAMALSPPAPYSILLFDTETKDIERKKAIAWLLQQTFDPNAQCCTPDYSWLPRPLPLRPFGLTSSPLQAAIAFFLSSNNAEKAGALGYLARILKLGGDISRSAIFYTSADSVAQYRFLTRVDDFLKSKVFLEANLAWILTLVLQHAVQQGIADSVVQDLNTILRMSHVAPCLTKIRVLAWKHWLSDGMNEKYLRKYHSTDDPGCLSTWEQLFLERDFRLGWDRHRFRPRQWPAPGTFAAIEEVMEVGTIVTTDDVVKEWISKDMVWSPEDERYRRVPKPDWMVQGGIELIE